MFCILSRTTALPCALLLVGCAHRFHGSGFVLAVNGSEVTISHRAIPGYMPAMAMPFNVSPKTNLAALAPGSRVAFELKAGKHSTQITRIRIDAGPAPDFPLPGVPKTFQVGEVVPDFELIDEQGKPARLSDSRGRLSLIEFIYTRCPLPDVCPRLSANFALLQRKFGREVALLSITIDPEHDTPAVLLEYAARWRADAGTWRFLTGDPPEIQRVAGMFGLVYFAEEGAITHTSVTALIGRDGRLLAQLAGSSYTARQLSDLVAAKIPE